MNSILSPSPRVCFHIYNLYSQLIDWHGVLKTVLGYHCMFRFRLDYQTFCLKITNCMELRNLHSSHTHTCHRLEYLCSGPLYLKNNDVTNNLIWAQLCNNGHLKQLPGQPSLAGPPYRISCLNKPEIEFQHLRQNISDKKCNQ